MVLFFVQPKQQFEDGSRFQELINRFSMNAKSTGFHAVKTDFRSPFQRGKVRKHEETLKKIERMALKVMNARLKFDYANKSFSQRESKFCLHIRERERSGMRNISAKCVLI